MPYVGGVYIRPAVGGGSVRPTQPNRGPNTDIPHYESQQKYIGRPAATWSGSRRDDRRRTTSGGSRSSSRRSGGWGSYGRGGGGGGRVDQKPGIDQKTFDWLLKQYRDNRPDNYEFSPYEGEFYDWDNSQYGMMRDQVAQGIAADRATGTDAFRDARTELQNYQDPFAAGVQTASPSVEAAMSRMMAANQAQSGAGAEVDAQSRSADRALGNVLGLLSGVDRQRQGSNLRALAGDERRFNEGLSNQARQMNFQINMVEAKNKAQYEKDKWAYGEQIAQQNYKTNMEIDMANLQQQNEYTQGMLQLLAELAQAGIDPDTAKQSLDLTKAGISDE